uniref:Trk system potassium uptake protein (TrkA) n=1 Tax=uncultured marine group II/III euryarchaeote AD1000_66_E09 TaxID=1457798 RepID=A0A075FW31_9EURY|nr:trk system potassium uptake protein (trkA) [uncultured marine group II/III euryarchaeote AD1000_66_E09]
MNVVIMGCGRVGARIASELDSEGHAVSVIDMEVNAFQLLPREFQGKRVSGNGVDRRIQLEAGIEAADVFMALANGDNRNAMAAQVAMHQHKVERVVARIFDPERAEVYRELGIEAVNPTTVVAQLALEAAFGTE